MSNDEDHYDIDDWHIHDKKKKSKDLALLYDSDSSVESTENLVDAAVNSRDELSNSHDQEKGSASTQLQEPEDMDDMFADEEDKPAEIKQIKPDPEVPVNDDYAIFETQEPHKYDGIGSTTENDDEDEENEEEAANYYNKIEDFDGEGNSLRKKWKVKIEAFGKEGGSIKDPNENYDVTSSASEGALDAQDELLSGVKKSEILKARKAHEKREQFEKSQAKSGTVSLDRLLGDLIANLLPAETVLEAMARLGKARDKKEHGSGNSDVKASIIHLTECCDALMVDEGFHNIYDLSREELIREYSSVTGSDYNTVRGLKRSADDAELHVNTDGVNDDYGEKIWMYKWKGDIEVHGPFSSYEMSYWKKNYFENDVLVKQVTEDDFVDIVIVDFE